LQKKRYFGQKSAADIHLQEMLYTDAEPRVVVIKNNKFKMVNVCHLEKSLYHHNSVKIVLTSW